MRIPKEEKKNEVMIFTSLEAVYVYLRRLRVIGGLIPGKICSNVHFFFLLQNPKLQKRKSKKLLPNIFDVAKFVTVECLAQM
jgi:hypothetical protein